MSNIKIKVQRFNPKKDKKPYFKEYIVPFKPTMRVLDALKYIQNNIDGTLAFRWNCSAGICGSCAMEVNGIAVLTCKTELKKMLRKIKIAPLSAFPIIKDLVVDYSQVYFNEKGLNLHFIKKKSGKMSFLKIYDKEIQEVKKFKSCIECFICNNNCKPFRDNNFEFIGPKSIVKSITYDKHPKDTLNRYSLVNKKGLWYCNITRCCQSNCPQEIPITDRGLLPMMSKKNSSKYNNN